MKQFKNIKFYSEGKGMIEGNILFNETIVSISDKVSQSITNAEVVEIPENAFVVPAFIDEHIHGAASYDFMDGTETAISTIANSLAKEGTAAFLATTVSASEEKTLSVLSEVKKYRELNLKSGAEVLGVHLEGPFLSDKMCGAMNTNYLRVPNCELADKFIEASGNCVKLITYAPELDLSDEFFDYIFEKDIALSVGHSNSDFETIERLVKKGLKGCTHTYNAQRPLHHREIGCVGAALLLDELQCEIIADGIHVSIPAIQLLTKNKRKDKITLVTDSMRAKGMPEGVSEIGEQRVIVKNGEARIENGRLAGSVLRMNIAVKNMVEKVGVPLLDAIDFATINPARTLGIDKEYGGIAVGKKANFTVLDDKFEVLMTIREGNIIY